MNKEIIITVCVGDSCSMGNENFKAATKLKDEVKDVPCAVFESSPCGKMCSMRPNMYVNGEHYPEVNGPYTTSTPIEQIAQRVREIAEIPQEPPLT